MIFSIIGIMLVWALSGYIPLWCCILCTTMFGLKIMQRILHYVIEWVNHYAD